MAIAHPRPAEEAYKIINYAFQKNDGPFVIRYERGTTLVDQNQPITNEIATTQWETLQQGSDVVFVAFGSILDKLLSTIQEEQISIEVVNAMFIKPLDTEKINELIARDIPIILYEESVLQGGFGSSVLEYCVEHQLPTHNLHLMGIKEQYVSHGSKSELLKELKLDVDSIIETIHTLVQS